jgi:dihydropteroate synthase
MHYLANIPIDIVRIMGVINVSPESFYRGSVRVSKKQIEKASMEMEEAGADFIDVGAMSTAPYLKTMISQEKEIERMKNAVRAIRDSTSVPISVDTPRASTAQVALNAGATIVNDVTGLKYDPEMSRVVSDNGASVVLCAYEKHVISGDVIRTALAALRSSVKIAEDADINPDRIVVDPAIGFFREKGSRPFFTKMKGSKWFDRDLTLITRLKKLKVIRKPICVSVSRKSFIGKILSLENPADRLIGSVTAEAICVLNGANVIRTHNVRETLHSVRIAEALLNYMT